MKTGILITARLGSTRLKKKHLLTVNGKSLLYYLVSRIRQEFIQEIENQQISIIIATSDEAENREFERLGAENVQVFYGSLLNIPLRHMQVANAYELDNIIAVDGDDILCSPRAMRSVYKMLCDGKPYVKTSDLPIGLNAFGYSVDFLKNSVQASSETILETGWGRIFDNSQITDIKLSYVGEQFYEQLRFTLDYQLDYQFFTKIIEEFGDDIVLATDDQILELVVSQEWYKINGQLSEEYWKNFHDHVEKEKLDKKGCNGCVE